MSKKILKFILFVQGLYYILASLWAIVSLSHFSRITNYDGRGYEVHSIAGLGIVLGLFFLWGALNKDLLRPAGFVALGSAVAVIIPEWIYLSQLGNPPLFWVDFFEELVIAIVLAVILFRGGKK